MAATNMSANDTMELEDGEIDELASVVEAGYARHDHPSWQRLQDQRYRERPIKELDIRMQGRNEEAANLHRTGPREERRSTRDYYSPYTSSTRNMRDVPAQHLRRPGTERGYELDRSTRGWSNHGRSMGPFGGSWDERERGRQYAEARRIQEPSVGPDASTGYFNHPARANAVVAANWRVSGDWQSGNGSPRSQRDRRDSRSPDPRDRDSTRRVHNRYRQRDDRARRRSRDRW